LATIGSWLQCNFDTPAKEIDARDGGDASNAIATRLWTHNMERVAGAKRGDQRCGAKLEGDASRG
jgi:hypothetical protein